MENLTKENVYVKVESKEQAEMYKAVLQSINKDYVSGFDLDDYPQHKLLGRRLDGGYWLSSGYDKYSFTEVSFGQLIDLLTNREKIAVRVENEKEFNALLRHFVEMKYRFLGDLDPVWSNWNGDPLIIQYKDDCETIYESFFMRGDDDFNGYKIIPFSDFAKEHDIRLPIITTVDGVDLFEGDYCFVAEHIKVWKLDEHTSSEVTDKNMFIVSANGNFVNTDDVKIFSTKQAAEKWIEERNSIILSPELSDKCNFSLIGHSNDKTSIPINILTDIHAELCHAESKHPDWPEDKLYGASIVAEEFGEMMREAVKIQMNEPDASVDNLRKEAIQTAATCIRLLKNL